MSKHTTEPSSNEIPYGYCHCGCGQKTPPASRTHTQFGHIKGEPLKYLFNHHKRVYASVEDSFRQHFTTGHPDKCWEWQGTMIHTGYGRLWFRDRAYIAHRLSYEVHIGPIPEGLVVCHRCDNRKCVNPGHLFLGTSQDNTADMVQKRRHRFGEGSHNALLTETQVQQIRLLVVAGVKQRDIAREFHISQTTVWQIKNRLTWRHVP